MRTVEVGNWSQENLHNAMLIMRNLIDRLEHNERTDTFKLNGALTRTDYRTLVLAFHTLEAKYKEVRRDA